VRTKLLVEDYRRIDVRRLARDGFLVPGARRRLHWLSGGEVLGTITVTAGSTFVDIIGEGGAAGVGETVTLTESDCNLGGTRPWWLCPSCDRRCALIYIDIDKALRCRECLRAVYLVSTLGRSDRRQDRVEKTRARLHFDASGHAVKPEGMHLKTWLRRWQEHDAARQAVVDEVAAWVDKRMPPQPRRYPRSRPVGGPA